MFKNSFFLLSIRIFSLIGIITMLYLFHLHFSVVKNSLCELGQGFSCEQVNTSQYSKILGIPVSFLGLVYFLYIFLISFFKIKNRFFFLPTLFVLFPSLYLSGIEFFVLKNICIFCEFSKFLMLLILLFSFWSLKKESKLPSKQEIILTSATGIVASFITWYLQSKPPVLVSYDHLASCLTKQGVVMYSSITCPVCARVRETFGPSYKYLNVVECHPQGKDSKVALCLQKKIEKTPTWIIEKEGVEVKRNVGFLNVEELAKFADCETSLEKDKKGG